MVAMGPDRISQNADLFVLVVRSYTVPLRHQAGDNDERTVTTYEFLAFLARVFLPRVSVKLSAQVTPSDDPEDCDPH